MDQSAPEAATAAAPPALSDDFDVPEDKALLEYVEAFLVRTGMKPSRFGIDAMGEGGLVKSLRDGRSMSLKKARQVVGFIRAHDAKEAEAEATPRPFNLASSEAPPGRLLRSLAAGAEAAT